MALKARVGSRWYVRDALPRPSGEGVLWKAEHFFAPEAAVVPAGRDGATQRARAMDSP